MNNGNRSDILAEKLRQQILHGRWPVGAPLPSTRQLAREHNVSPNTVHGVLRELSAQGLVELQPRRGRFVLSTSLPEGSTAGRTVSQVGIVRPVRSLDDAEKHDLWSTHIVEALEDVFISDELRLTLLSYVPTDSTWPERVLEQIDQIGADLAGLICFMAPGVEPLLAKLTSRNVPWVTINRPDASSTTNFVTADNLAGGRAVGGLFADLGFRRVLLIGNREPVFSSGFEKITGAIQAYVTRGLPLGGIDVVGEAVSSQQTGYEIVSSYLADHPPPQGIFCIGDLLALGAMSACLDAGLSVPDDVSIVGSTGTAIGAYTRPPLTTHAQPMAEMGRRAGLMLLRMVREGIHQLPGERIQGRLILRQSLKPLPPELLEQVTG